MNNEIKICENYLNRYERMVGPLGGFVIPFSFAVLLAIVTAVGPVEKELVFPVVPPPPPEEFDPPPEPEPPEPVVDTPPEPEITFEIETPTPQEKFERPSLQPEVFAEQESVKPADADTVRNIRSPVLAKNVLGGPRGRIGRPTVLTGGPKYGDEGTERSVLLALRWLKKTQKTDGSWAPQPVANTALALLCYLAHGETPGSEEFGETVERALDYLIGALHEEPDGKVRFRGSDGNEYAFLIGTYALAEAYGMTRHPDAKEAALKGLVRIIGGQSPTGGWDYKLNRESTRDDMSYAGWALQALKAGKLAGLRPEGIDECVKKAMHCLAKRNFSNGGFNYTAGGKPTGLTATGCLAMQLLGYGDRGEVSASLDTMREWLPTFSKDELKIGGASAGLCPQYYCYYATQCKYQSGMCVGAEKKNEASWAKWNEAMKRLYLKTIVVPDEKIEGPDGKPCAIGYWRNTDAHGAGDTMSTCLCALQLMVYYRYLPTTKVSKI